MPQLELNQDPCGEQSEHSQKDDDDYAGHQTNDSQRRGQGEHSVAHDLGYHENGNELP